MAVSPLVFPRRRRVFELSLWAFLGHLPATPHVQGIFHFFISKRSVSDTWAFHMCKASLRHASLGARFGASGDSADLWWGPARTSPARGGFPFLTALARQSGSSKWPGWLQWFEVSPGLKAPWLHRLWWRTRHVCNHATPRIRGMCFHSQAWRLGVWLRRNGQGAAFAGLVYGWHQGGATAILLVDVNHV